MGSLFSISNPILDTDTRLSPLGYNLPTGVLTPNKIPTLRTTWYNPSTKTRHEVVYTFDGNHSREVMISRVNTMFESISHIRGSGQELLIDAHGDKITFSYK